MLDNTVIDPVNIKLYMDVVAYTVALASVVVKVTPTPKDDLVVNSLKGKLFVVLKALSLALRDEKKIP